MAKQNRNFAPPTEYGKVSQSTINEIGKLPPQAPELENVVLGALMLEKEAYSEVSEFLKAECFYSDANAYIYTAISTLGMQYKPTDYLMVIEELKRMGKLDEVGGAVAISELTNNVASTASIVSHAQIIVQKFLARELIRTSTDVQQKAFDDKSDIEELMQYAEGQLFEITNNNIKKDVLPIGSVLGEVIDKIQKASTNNNDGEYTGIASGFTALDNITSGWHAPDLIIIAARPAMGKTAFVLSMAKNMAVDAQIPVAMFSLEMSNAQLVERILVNVVEIGGEKIKKGKLEPYEWEQLSTRSEKLQNAPIFIDDTPGLSIFELRSKARRLVREQDVKCIIIDYLQLMNASGMSFGSREQEVSLISRSLKGLAKELKIPIIALSQLNRGVEGRTGAEKRPQLSDLRESGAIEQDADMVLMLHRSEYYKIYEDQDGNDMRGVAEVIIAKHRSGSTGDVKLCFKSEFIKFTNLGDNMPDFVDFASADTSNSSYSSNFSGNSIPPEKEEGAPF